MLSWILLSDVGDEDGPTKIVPLSVGKSVPYWPVPGHHDITNYLPEGMFAEEEVSMTGPAGTLFAFRSDVLHRGSRMTGERSTRFALLADYDVWAPRWTGKVAWAERPAPSDATTLPVPRSVSVLPGTNVRENVPLHAIGAVYVAL